MIRKIIKKLVAYKHHKQLAKKLEKRAKHNLQVATEAWIALGEDK